MPKMSIDSNGKLVCPSNPSLITYNSPWPTKNGSWNFVEPAYGYVLHTEVGYEKNVIDEFNNTHAQASAFFSIGMDGHIHQYGPVGKKWKAWTQAGGNSHYRGVEHEDHGNPKNPLSAAQIESTASVLEAVSKHDGFPLEATDNPNGGKGVLFHSDGGSAWGGHDCPGAIRRGQRPAILNRAKQLRGTAPKPTPIPAPKPHPAPAPSSAVHALQQAVHVSADGLWGAKTDAALQAVRSNKHTKAEQTAVGTKADGVWGVQSQKNYNITIHRVQAALKVTQDGSWGPKTDSAFLALRGKYYKASLLSKVVAKLKK